RGALAHGDDLLVVDDDRDPAADLAADEGAAVKRRGHTQIVPSTVGRPPVAPGTFVSSPAIESLAMSAMAIASFSCKYLYTRTSLSGSRSRSMRTSVGFLAPPPARMTSSTRRPMKSPYALAMLSAVNAVAVAIRSSPAIFGNCCSMRRANWRPKRSRPDAFGGRSWKYGSDMHQASTRSSTWPRAARTPSRSNVSRRWLKW